MWSRYRGRVAGEGEAVAEAPSRQSSLPDVGPRTLHAWNKRSRCPEPPPPASLTLPKEPLEISDTGAPSVLT